MAATGAADLTLGGGDPRRPSLVNMDGHNVPVGPATSSSVVGRNREKHVSFEEYLYYAKVTRADQRYEEPNPDYKIFSITLKKNRHGGESDTQQLTQFNGAKTAESTANERGIEDKPSADTKEGHGGSSAGVTRRNISDEEYTFASRALRTAAWPSVFFLITTDILGPFNVPTGFAYMGYGPGVALFTVFGFFAGYGGFLLWKLFLGLDSDRYPVRLFGDLAHRVYGPWGRRICNLFQAVQLFINVGVLIVQNGVSLEQIIVGSGRGSVCFVALCVVWTAAGALLGQIRMLQNLGWVANFSVWLNLFTIFMVMGVVTHSVPNYDVAIQINGPVLAFDDIGPVQTFGGPPPGTDFSVQVEGLQLAIAAFGGAVIFVELMAEMKRPFDFWKGMICAQMFIYFFYMLFGLFVYSYQGQYTTNPAYQSISPYAWQTVGNVVQLVSSLIAAVLYGNIGLKVVYNAIFMDLFGLPNLGTRIGKLLWVGLVPLYWGLSFVVGAAIPQITNLSALLAAVTITQFSYTFPPLLYAGFLIRRDAILPGDGFDPATGQMRRQDSGFKRYARGFKKHWALNCWHIFLTLGSLCTAVLGIYSAIKGMIVAYGTGVQSSFSCTSPYG